MAKRSENKRRATSLGGAISAQARTIPHAADVPKSSSLALDDILKSVGEAPYQWCIDDDALHWGPNATDIFGIRDASLIATGRAFATLLDAGNVATRFDTVMCSPLSDNGQGVPYQIQYCLSASPRAKKIWIEDTGRWFAGPDGRPIRAHGIVRCINDRHAQEEHLAYLSRCDGLTGEINRWHLTEMLEKTLQETKQTRGSCAFLLVAIDNLSRVNESYGYDVADEVIGAVSKRLRTRMRGEDCLGRFSGNKFGVILKNCSPEEAAVAANRLLTCVRDDVVVTVAGPISVTATIGGVTAPRHAGSVHEILLCAQETLDRAKDKRPGSFLAYRPSPERDALRCENVRLTDEIVTALNERRILLAFEPIVDIKTREAAFYECLMRIRRADGALIPALDVISVAERLGLVRLLDHRVLHLAVTELVASSSLHASLNVSPSSTIDPDWWSRLSALLRAHPGAAERLTVEITEMTAIHDIDEARGFVTRVKDLGCKIAIDDFGAGYTSFQNLRKLGVDIVKIDGSFVQNLTRSQDDRAFVRTLIDLGRRLDLKTVAEWVQDEESAALLAEWGCDYIQGALVGRAATERPKMSDPESAITPATAASS